MPGEKKKSLRGDGGWLPDLNEKGLGSPSLNLDPVNPRKGWWRLISHWKLIPFDLIIQELKMNRSCCTRILVPRWPNWFRTLPPGLINQPLFYSATLNLVKSWQPTIWRTKEDVTNLNTFWLTLIVQPITLLIWVCIIWFWFLLLPRPSHPLNSKFSKICLLPPKSWLTKVILHFKQMTTLIT